MPPLRFWRRRKPDYDEALFLPPERREEAKRRRSIRGRLRASVEGEELIEGGWLDDVVRPLILAGLNLCLVNSLIRMAQSIDPSIGRLTYLQIAVLLVSLEGIYSLRIGRRLELFSTEDVLKFRGTELVVILLLLKLLSYLPQGYAALLADIPRWVERPSNFFDGGYIVSCIVVSAFWLTSISLAQDFDNLKLQSLEEAPSVLSKDYDMWVSSPSRYVDRTGAFQRISGKFFWGGGVLVISSGLARIGLAQALSTDRPPISGILLNVFLYFILGLALLSQGQLLLHKAHWQLQRIEVSPEVSSRWARSAVGLLLLAAILAIALPTEYSFGLLDALRMVLRLIFYVLVLIVSLPFTLLGLILSALLGRRPAAGGLSSNLQLPKLPPQEEARAGLLPPIFHYVKNLLFWLLMLGIVGYCIYTFLRYRSGLWHSLLRASPLWTLMAGLLNLWRRLWGLAGEATQRMRASWGVGAVISEGRKGLRAPWRFLRLSSLAPRELIGYFYISTVRRAARLGHVRRIYQTPYEYTASLAQHLSEAQEELKRLTEAFVEARYSRHAITKDDSNLAKGHWQRVRDALRLWKRRREQGDGSL